MKIPREAVTRVALWKQGLYRKPTAASKDEMLGLIRQLGCVQLDALNVVTRSHNLVFLARMAEYEEAWFQDLYEERRVFEGYVHALSLLPMEERPWIEPMFRAFREKLMAMEPKEVDQVFDLYNEVKRLAPVTSRQLTGDSHETARGNEPWSVTPVRWGLDQLWRSGLITAGRDLGFHKTYDLTEQWVPDDFLHSNVSLAEYELRYAERALDAMGIATEAEVADYFRLRRPSARKALARLLQQGLVQEVTVPGEQETHYLRTCDVELVQEVSDAEPPSHAALLSPFDNLIWHRERTMKLFDLDYRLESYLPADQRTYGYFALPILVAGRLVGTLDLKLERKQQTLIVKRRYVKNVFEREELRPQVERLLERLMCHLGAAQLIEE